MPSSKDFCSSVCDGAFLDDGAADVIPGKGKTSVIATKNANILAFMLIIDLPECLDELA